jgi:hypothetical protein
MTTPVDATIEEDAPCWCNRCAALPAVHADGACRLCVGRPVNFPRFPDGRVSLDQRTESAAGAVSSLFRQLQAARVALAETEVAGVEGLGNALAPTVEACHRAVVLVQQSLNIAITELANAEYRRHVATT